MSLTIAAHNGEDIVVGSETMGVVEDHGENIKQLDHNKIFTINNHTALLLVGDKFDWWVVGQFIRDFTYVVKAHSLNEFDDIFRVLAGMSGDTLKLQEDTEIQFTLAGFNKAQPAIRDVRLKSQDQPKIGELVPGETYLVAGYQVCIDRAHKILENKKARENNKIADLEVALSSTIDQCKDEFDQLLGGETVVRVIKRSM